MRYLMGEDVVAVERMEEAEAAEEAVEPSVTGTTPIYIEGMKNKQLYANMPNAITIYVQGGTAAHLRVTANGGTIKVVDAAKGKYTFFEPRAGFIAEVLVEDTLTGKRLAQTFDVVNIPAPTAYIWKARTPTLTITDKLSAEQLRQQNAVVLVHDRPIPALCAARSYTLIRIAANGKREEVAINSNRGTFSEQGQKMIEAAASGDVYIVRNIKTACTPEPIKDIVYYVD